MARLFFGFDAAPVQPVPQVTAEDIARVVRRDFPPDQVDAVFAMLAEYGTQPWHREPERVQIAALKLADGDLDKLRNAIDRAKQDYREVLAPAEYPKYTKVGFRAVRLRSQQRQQIYRDDWQQYERWLRK